MESNQGAMPQESPCLYSDEEILMIQDKDLSILLQAKKTAAETMVPVSQGSGNGKCYEQWGRRAPCNHHHCPVIEALETGEASTKEISRNDGKIMLVKAIPFFDNNGNFAGVLKSVIDPSCYHPTLSKEQDTLRQLQESQTRFSEFCDSLPGAVFEMDLHGIITYFNSKAIEMYGFPAETLSDNFQAIRLIHPKDRSRVIGNFYKRLSGHLFSERSEYTAVKKNGEQFPVLVHAIPILKDGKPVGLRGFYLDISAYKQTLELLEFSRQCDALTGLYNRSYFNDRLENLDYEDTPTAIIVIDVDGLKIVNDALGHELGDVYLKHAAEAIKSCLRKNDVAARVGGDEFAILLPQTSEIIARDICRKIKKAAFDNTPAQEYGFPLNISTGWAIAYTPETINEVIRQADDNMCREKLHQNQSIRSTVVRTMMEALEARHPVTKHHAEQIHKLIRIIGNALGLADREMDDLCLFAQFHDIGKVGVSDKVLLKPGPLTKRERMEMQRHTEIGHRIAISSPDLAPIADWILKHHEWWDGSGYPLGLTKKQIPLECRILSVIDAYDAMTSFRAYRKAVSHEAAIEELQRCAGTQFDPEIVGVFINAYSPYLNGNPNTARETS